MSTSNAIAGPSSSRPSAHTRSGSVSQAQQQRTAQLASSYASLASELSSTSLKVVGGYTLGRVIGEGTFGSVHIGTHRLTSTRCAVKRVPKSNLTTSQLTREIHHHRTLRHPYVVQLYEVIATENTIWLVTELCTGGELFDYLVERGRLLESEARRIFGELVVAVGTMHARGTVHRDLKLENVLLDGDCRVKLGDLGFAREWVRGNKLLETFCGTTGYAAPEMLQGRKYAGELVDVWSLGIILYTLLSGGLPFDDDDEEVMKQLIFKGEYEEPEWLSDEAKDLVRNLIQLEPTKRLSIRGILSHAWFKKHIVDPPLETLMDAAAAHYSPHALHGHHSHQAAAAGATTSVEASPDLSRVSSSSYFPPHPTAAPLRDVDTRLLSSFTPAEPSPLSSPPHEPSAATFSPAHFDATPASGSETGSSSQTSYDFHHSEPESSAGTTAVEDDEHGDVVPELQKSGDERTELRTSHSNESQTTIRKSQQQSQSDLLGQETPARRSVRVQISEDVDESDGYDSRRQSGNFDEHSLHLPLAGHSRTPSRTKRRSVSSTVSDRRPSLMNNHSWSAAAPIVDYLAQLDASPPPFFSTTSEKKLLESLSMLGFDIGQIMHSVNSDACDASSALWWMMREKQAEREHEQMFSAANSGDVSQEHVDVDEEQQVKVRVASPDTKPMEMPTLGAPLVATPLSAPEIVEPVERTPVREEVSPPRGRPPAPPQPSPASIEGETSSSPSKQGKKIEAKERKPSFTMLQRATSALTGSALVVKKSEDKLTPNALDDGITKSPKKLLKTPPLSKVLRKEGGGGILELPPVSDPRDRHDSAGSTISHRSAEMPTSSSFGTINTLALSADESPTKSKTSSSAGRKEGLLTTFKSWWNEDRRKRSKQVPTSAETYLTPGRAHALRSQHHPAVKRSTVVARRLPQDATRPAMHSRRSSSANSRRSSITSLHIPTDFGAYDPYAPRRRNSRRSNGSRTPTSEAEHPGPLSRASSVHSLQLVRTPSGPTSSGMHRTASISSAGSGGKTPSRPPRAHVRATSASSRNTHLRASSGVSPNRSGASSRRSSVQQDVVDSGDDSASTRSRKKSHTAEHYHPAVLIAHRTRSPLSTSFPSHHRPRRGPIRDVFAKKPGDPEDEWVDEDEQTGFAGGLGQSGSLANKSLRVPDVGRDSPNVKAGASGRVVVSRPSDVPALAVPLGTARGKAELHAPPPPPPPVAIGRGNFSRLPSSRPADVMEEEEPEE